MNGYINLEIGGRKRGLKFGTRAILDLVEMLNLDLSTMNFKQDFKTISAIVYCGLISNCKIKREDPDFTLLDVEDWVDDLGLVKLTDVFTTFAATLSSINDASEEEKKKVMEVTS